jgi:hypothetical protein
MGAVKINGGLSGGTGDFSGLITSPVSIASVTINGSVTGGAGENSGTVLSQANLGPVTIGTKAAPANLTGGSGESSGQIFADGTITKVTINGSIAGGSIEASGGALKSLTVSGTITGGGASGDSLGTVSVGGDLVGGFLIALDGPVTSITINGSVSSFAPASTSAFIAANTIFGSLTIKGSVTGIENGTSSTTPVIIAAGGNGGLGKTDLAIKSISIGGDASFANILAGYDSALHPIDRHAGIGSVTVAGNLTASNIVAGAINTASNNKNFGDNSDATIPPSSGNDTSSILSTIASIKIGGTVTGTSNIDNPNDHFGIVARQITALSINGTNIALTPGPSNDNTPLGATGDFTLDEIT